MEVAGVRKYVVAIMTKSDYVIIAFMVVGVLGLLWLLALMAFIRVLTHDEFD